MCLFLAVLLVSQASVIVSLLTFGCNLIDRPHSVFSVIVILLDFSLTVKAAPHECVIRTSQP